MTKTCCGITIGMNVERFRNALVRARIRIIRRQQIVTEQNERLKSDIADDLRKGRFEIARYKAEHLVRQMVLVETLELLEVYCEHLQEVCPIFTTDEPTVIGEQFTEAIASLVWITPRLSWQVEELKEITRQIRAKYGSSYTLRIERDQWRVNENLIQKIEAISGGSVDQQKVEEQLRAIATLYRVWEYPTGQPAASSPLGPPK